MSLNGNDVLELRMQYDSHAVNEPKNRKKMDDNNKYLYCYRNPKMPRLFVLIDEAITALSLPLSFTSFDVLKGMVAIHNPYPQ